MRRSPVSVVPALFMAAATAALAACSDTASPGPIGPDLNHIPGLADELTVCKRGPAGTYGDFTVTMESGNPAELLKTAFRVTTDGSTGPTAEQCVLVWRGVTAASITVKEVAGPGVKLQDVFFNTTEIPAVDGAVTVQVGNGGGVLRFTNVEAPVPSLSVVKTADAEQIEAGDEIGFTIVVTSNGPGTATGVTLTDVLPTGNGINWSIESSDPSCAIVAGTLSCDFGDLAAGVSRGVHVVSETTMDSCKTYTNVASVSSTNHATVSDDASVVVNDCTPPPPPGGGEGCTPGYWKQKHHFDSWTLPYTPTTQFSAVFSNAFPGKTLVQVLGQGGGGIKALGRHAVAALLNAASSGVSYDLSTSEIITAFNEAYASGNANAIESLKNDFEGFNEQGCPLN